jgi:hypothetical protein
MEICHLTLTAERGSRLPLFSDESAYQRALWRLGVVAGGCLALFALVAEHLHLVALLARAAAGRLAQRVVLALRPIVATPFAPSYIKIVDSRSYMRWLLRYVLEQPRHHGMPGHPALWVGACLPELVGARLVGGLALQVKRALPEFTAGMALRLVGLDGASVLPANLDTLRAAGLPRLQRALAATLATPPSLGGLQPTALLARRMLAHLAREVEIPSAEVARSLGRSPETTWRLCQGTVDPELRFAVARRVALENLVGGRQGS